MRLAHVRDRHAPAGAPWRLAAGWDIAGSRWLDLETARRRALRARPDLEHDAILFRQPVTTLDAKWSYDWTKSASMSLKLENITDPEYETTQGDYTIESYTRGRTITFGMGYEF